MSATIITGLQWGDEGKGKISGLIAQYHDIVIRFHGGNNAGHVVYHNGVPYKICSLPSSVFYENKISVLGNGMVLNPWALKEEIERLTKAGLKITQENLKIAENTCFVLPIHIDMDKCYEKIMRNQKRKTDAFLGTTGRGIGPAYQDKVGRRAIRVSDLFSEEILLERINILSFYHDIFRRKFGFDRINQEKLFYDLMDIRSFISPFVTNCWRFLQERNKKRLLFEGAQGFMLDVDHGTYPFVTSSNTLPLQIFNGTGFSDFNSIKCNLGILKAYVTRVGTGPFPTEIKSSLKEKLIRVGEEVGTNTGRTRRCGWLDIVMLRQAIEITGVNYLALLKVDVLDSFEEIKICIAYEFEKEVLNYFPSSLEKQNAIIPVYENITGWKTSSRGLTKWDDLPINLRKFITRIEELCGRKIAIISTGPRRNEVIFLKKIF